MGMSSTTGYKIVRSAHQAVVKPPFDFLAGSILERAQRNRAIQLRYQFGASKPQWRMVLGTNQQIEQMNSQCHR